MGGFSYPDAFSYEAELIPEAMGAGALGVFVVAYILVMLFAMAWSLAVYILHALGLYSIADRRGIRHAWLAWIPLGNIWILGSISDQYQYVAKGKIKNRRRVLLALSIVLYLMVTAWLIGILVNAVVGDMGGVMLWLLLGMLAFLVFAIVLLVLEYMAYYDLFTSCQPNNGVLYLILSILFPVTMPFFVFACRKKDLGMPPRKQPVLRQVIVPVQEEAVEAEIAEEPLEEGFANPEEFEEE